MLWHNNQYCLFLYNYFWISMKQGRMILLELMHEEAIKLSQFA